MIQKGRQASPVYTRGNSNEKASGLAGHRAVKRCFAYRWLGRADNVVRHRVLPCFDRSIDQKALQTESKISPSASHSTSSVHRMILHVLTSQNRMIYSFWRFSEIFSFGFLPEGYDNADSKYIREHRFLDDILSEKSSSDATSEITHPIRTAGFLEEVPRDSLVEYRTRAYRHNIEDNDEP